MVFATRSAWRVGFILAALLLSACDEHDGVADIERAARHGDAEAQLQLALRYLDGDDDHDGDGVKADTAQARHWLELSAAQGLARSQFHLARLYLDQHAPMLRGKARALLEAAHASDERMADEPLAELLATSPDSTPQDGLQAVSLIEAALRNSVAGQDQQFEILAAAYARAGRFAEAVGAERHAVVGADCSCEAKVLRQRKRRLAAYQRGETWDQPLSG